MLVARRTLMIFLAFLVLLSGGLAAGDLSFDSLQKCAPLTPMWALDFEEITGTTPKSAHQCDGENYSFVFVEFEDESESLAAEKTINENLEGEVVVIEGEEAFWEVYWSSSEELGTLRVSNILYLIKAPSINSSIIGAILNDSLKATSPESEKPVACTVWSKTFGGSNRDLGYSVLETADGGYIIAGQTDSYGVGKNDVLLLKTNSNGTWLWFRTFGGLYDDVGYSVQETSDGGYIITGGFGYSDAERIDLWLIKTDSSGNEQWSRTFRDGGWATGREVLETRDGGFIIAGWNGADDVWLIKTDSSGDKEWDRTFGGDYSDWGNSVRETTDGGYIIAAETESFGAYPRDIWLIKTDAHGYEEWDRLFGGTEAEYTGSAQQTTDGGYIVVGEIESSEDMSRDIWLIKTDALGNWEWERVYGGSDDDRGRALQQTTDGGYVIAGGTSSYGRDSLDLWLVKVDQSGAEEWNRTFGGPGVDKANSVQQTADGGYILTGFTESYGAGDRDIWLIKTDSQGNADLEMED